MPNIYPCLKCVHIYTCLCAYLRLFIPLATPCLKVLAPQPKREHSPPSGADSCSPYLSSKSPAPYWLCLTNLYAHQKSDLFLILPFLISFPLRLTEYLWVPSFSYIQQNPVLSPLSLHMSIYIHLYTDSTVLRLPAPNHCMQNTHAESHIYPPPTCHFLLCCPVPTSTPTLLNALSACGSWQHDSAKVPDAYMFHPKGEGNQLLSTYQAASCWLLPATFYPFLRAKGSFKS